MYQKDDLVKTTKKGVLNVGQVRSVSMGDVHVWSATTGQNDVFAERTTERATREEYDAQVELRMNPPKKAPAQLVVSPAAKVPVEKPKVYRWMCLECGHKYNGSKCPSCGGEDRILNNEKDADDNLFGVSRTEPVFPKD